MKPRFADTSYFLAILNPTDVSHASAMIFSRGSRQPVVTTAYVLIEVANFLSGTPRRRLFRQLLGALRADHRVTIVAASEGLMDRGCDLYCAREDKTWSLTDCISFEAMHERGITEALTADHHFEQAGFSALLKA